jgi:hypothetical protein
MAWAAAGVDIMVSQAATKSLLNSLMVAACDFIITPRDIGYLSPILGF